MLTRTPYIVEMFRYIAADVQDRSGIQVHYEHGHPAEIVTTLQLWSKSQDNSKLKFPLIALFQDFTEKRGEKRGAMCSASFNLIIATLTKPEYTATQRMANSFVPVLYPLYDALLVSVQRSGYFMEQSGMIKHDKTDRVNWGKSGLYGNSGNTFNDFIDAIELDNFQLTIKEFNCL